jgi:hypothetical protein
VRLPFVAIPVTIKGLPIRRSPGWGMPVTRGGLPFDDLSRRWHDLAERRLEHFTELYRSGRWQRYYASEEQFAARMLDVIRAAKVWARLAGRAQSAPADAPEMIQTEAEGLRPAA